MRNVAGGEWRGWSAHNDLTTHPREYAAATAAAEPECQGGVALTAHEGTISKSRDRASDASVCSWTIQPSGLAEGDAYRIHIGFEPYSTAAPFSVGAQIFSPVQPGALSVAIGAADGQAAAGGVTLIDIVAAGGSCTCPEQTPGDPVDTCEEPLSFTPPGASAKAVVENGEVGAIILGGGGSYMAAPAVALNGLSCVGVVLTARVGSLSNIDQTSGARGTGYTELPTVELLGGAASEAAQAEVAFASDDPATGALTFSYKDTCTSAGDACSCQENRGSGYQTSPAVTLSGGVSDYISLQGGVGAAVTELTPRAGTVGAGQESWLKYMDAVLPFPATVSLHHSGAVASHFRLSYKVVPLRPPGLITDLTNTSRTATSLELKWTQAGGHCTGANASQRDATEREAEARQFSLQRAYQHRHQYFVAPPTAFPTNQPTAFPTPFPTTYCQDDPDYVSGGGDPLCPIWASRIANNLDTWEEHCSPGATPYTRCRVLCNTCDPATTAYPTTAGPMTAAPTSAAAPTAAPPGCAESGCPNTENWQCALLVAGDWTCAKQLRAECETNSGNWCGAAVELNQAVPANGRRLDAAVPPAVAAAHAAAMARDARAAEARANARRLQTETVIANVNLRDLDQIASAQQPVAQPPADGPTCAQLNCPGGDTGGTCVAFVQDQWRCADFSTEKCAGYSGTWCDAGGGSTGGCPEKCNYLGDASNPLQNVDSCREECGGRGFYCDPRPGMSPTPGLCYECVEPALVPPYRGLTGTGIGCQSGEIIATDPVNDIRVPEETGGAANPCPEKCTYLGDQGNQLHNVRNCLEECGANSYCDPRPGMSPAPGQCFQCHPTLVPPFELDLATSAVGCQYPAAASASAACDSAGCSSGSFNCLLMDQNGLSHCGEFTEPKCVERGGTWCGATDGEVTIANTPSPTPFPITANTPSPTAAAPTSAAPTSFPSIAPVTSSPTPQPTSHPTSVPTRVPTSDPTTALPSASPSTSPSTSPSASPTTASPSVSPTTAAPTTAAPTTSPTTPAPTTAVPTFSCDPTWTCTCPPTCVFLSGAPGQYTAGCEDECGYNSFCDPRPGKTSAPGTCITCGDTMMPPYMRDPESTWGGSLREADAGRRLDLRVEEAIGDAGGAGTLQNDLDDSFDRAATTSTRSRRQLKEESTPAEPVVNYQPAAPMPTPYPTPSPTQYQLFAGWGCVASTRATVSPSTSPTTASPSASPSASPTTSPTASPTTRSPTTSPTTPSPTVNGDTAAPTVSPTTNAPTTGTPSTSPTTGTPTTAPTTDAPTTVAPTASPTKVPTGTPTVAPTTSPTATPPLVTCHSGCSAQDAIDSAASCCDVLAETSRVVLTLDVSNAWGFYEPTAFGNALTQAGLTRKLARLLGVPGSHVAVDATELVHTAGVAEADLMAGGAAQDGGSALAGGGAVVPLLIEQRAYSTAACDATAVEAMSLWGADAAPGTCLGACGAWAGHVTRAPRLPHAALDRVLACCSPCRLLHLVPLSVHLGRLRRGAERHMRRGARCVRLVHDHVLVLLPARPRGEPAHAAR